MKIIIPRKVEKYLEKQKKGDPKGIDFVHYFLNTELSAKENPTFMDNCKKMQGKNYKDIWRWRVGNYRIIAEVKDKELLIRIIEIATREKSY